MDDDRPISVKNRQPTSLRSLANYTSNILDTAHEPAKSMQSVENEMQNAYVKFIDIDSDLTELFCTHGSALSSAGEHLKPEACLHESDSANTMYQLQQLKILQQQNAVIESNLRAEQEKNAALTAELGQMDSDMKQLRMDFREKEDQVFLRPQ